MLNWGLLVDETALSSLLPAEYGRFCRPVQDALTNFLDGLPPAHQAAVLAAQAQLPETASPAARLALLARTCPALHKLGQILARDRRLAPELRQHLQELESLPATVPLETIQSVLARELGPLDRLGVTLLPPALAEASVAVVIPFQQDGVRDGREPQHGVFKVLKPGIEERLDEELELFERVGAHLDQRCHDLKIPPLDYQETFAQVRDMLCHEVRLDMEQRHLSLARTFYSGEPRVQIPALFEHCTPRVTTMERVSGGKVTEQCPHSWSERHRLANLVVETLIARPIFSLDRLALFHGDPHAGNLFLTMDQRLAILDWSLVGALGEQERIALAQIALGAATLDAGRIVSALGVLAGQRRVGQPALEGVVLAWLRRVRRGHFPGFAWLLGLLDEAVQTARLRVGADMLLFRKSLHALEGVVADIGGPGSRIDAVLLGEFLDHLAVEWPGRWSAPPDCRAFATRLSNADLFQFLLGLPWTVAHCLLEQSRDLWERGESALVSVGSGSG
jgi:ubiquinone biosynthesis protein